MKTQVIKVLFTAALFAHQLQIFAFCGFYVAKTDAKLFNQSSEVIIVRDGDRTIITMSNDYQGNARDFAMVVPVPVVLKESDIRLANPNVFSKLDAYSAPRLVEYHDANPCHNYLLAPVAEDAARLSSKSIAPRENTLEMEEEYQVTVEAEYSIGAYDILILSAEDSDGLERWLIDNNYKIPSGAKEVLEPYIKSNLNFFVVKVNLDRHQSNGFASLKPIQMSFHSNRFGLPIRLGMANSKTYQDLIVYAFTKTGRVETTNYRTTQIPTNRNVPLFVKENFGQFYKDLFKTHWKREGKNTVSLEYAWDLSSSNFVKCDPCASTPPVYEDLREAGIYWVNQQTNRGGSNYQGDVYFTRLHVRYDRKHFPQDLSFQVTPNKRSFQGRYVLQNPASGKIDCQEANNYFLQVVKRRDRELKELAALTGWDIGAYENYVDEYAKRIRRNPNGWFEPERNAIFPIQQIGRKPKKVFILLGLLAIAGLYMRWKAKVHRQA